jgi:hypothetical protein
VLAATLLAASLTLTGTTPAAAARGPADRQVAFTSWERGPELRQGRLDDLVVKRGRLRLDDPRRIRRIEGRRYELGRWTSPWVSPGFAFTELIPSWNARTPEGTLVEVWVRGRGESGLSSWDSLGRWAQGDQRFHRASRGSQRDDRARVAVDTFIAETSFTSWQIRVNLLRVDGSRRTPQVDMAGAVVSRIPSSTGVATSRPAAARGITLDVPRFSQMTHSGHYPRYGGGGEAWCSPTSVAMVLGYYDALPSADQTAWTFHHRDSVVDHVARMTYDYSYEGTGNWPFNAAYAENQVRAGFVTRFASLHGVERLIETGIPVITSVTFGRGQLDGAPISSTNGHLMVVVGFTESGDVVVNDPAARRNGEVRRTYDRGQFEDAWLKRGPDGGSGGVGYVIHDGDHPLPPRNGATSW